MAEENKAANRKTETLPSAISNINELRNQLKEYQDASSNLEIGKFFK